MYTWALYSEKATSTDCLECDWSVTEARNEEILEFCGIAQDDRCKYIVERDYDGRAFVYRQGCDGSGEPEFEIESELACSVHNDASECDGCDGAQSDAEIQLSGRE